MSEALTPIDPRLFELVSEVVRYGVELIRTTYLKDQFTLRYNNWPSNMTRGNELPVFFHAPHAGPIDYDQIIRRLSEVRQDAREAFSALVDYVETHSYLPAYFMGMSEHYLYHVRSTLASRYIHIYSDAPFSPERLLPIYLPIEAGLFKDPLPVDVVVPILFLRCDFDRVSLGTNIYIERIPDDFQVARMFEPVEHEEANSSAAGAATHALIISGRSLPNQDEAHGLSYTWDPDWYPRAIIDTFFTAARIVTGYNTGYAQLLVRPIGWVYWYIANLPPVLGTSVREYKLPSVPFLNSFTSEMPDLQPAPLLTLDMVEEIKRTFSKLTTLHISRLELASRRLNLCMLRTHDEDAILDATIAMELLLNDDETTEVTHKLALRMAALTLLAGIRSWTSKEVFHAVKRIYSYRSGVVHGNKKQAEKNRDIVHSDGSSVSSLEVAIEYVRIALGVLIDHPEYLASRDIDDMLLLDRLNSADPAF